LTTRPPEQRRGPPGSWGGLGAMVGLGSAVLVVVLILLSTFMSDYAEHRPGLLVFPALLSTLGLVFSPWIVPLAVYRFVVRYAERVYGASDDEIVQVRLVAGALYLMSWPLMMLVVFFVGMTGWPWR
jgi:hypothetical protein